jgi:hypothetical protein
MKIIQDLAKHLWVSKLSILGATMATVSAVLIITSWALDMLSIGGGPYRGLFAYGVLPGVFIVGLLFVPVGIWLARRKARRDGTEIRPLVIDLSRPEHRRRTILVLVLTLLNSIILSVAMYEGYHYTDSDEFCGTLCHTVMEPEYTAYQRSPHARVGCVECHIGGGASWFVKSKLSGLRQVYAVMAGTYSTPIPSPVEDLRPARETCEACHWPQFFHGKKSVVRRKLDDAADVSNPIVTVLLLNIGGLNARTGRYDGIHWHVSRHARVEYLPADAKRSRIHRIRSIREDGTVHEYLPPDSIPAPPAGTEWRTMDCVDCHNRPTHIFDEPQAVIDQALLDGKIPATLPGIRPLALALLTAAYPSHDGARDAIRSGLEKHYVGPGADPALADADAIRKAADGIFAIYRVNVFPGMKLTFGVHRSHLGHPDGAGGCFRCHDEEHATKEGLALSQDCSLCHELLAQEEPERNLDSKIADAFR